MYNPEERRHEILKAAVEVFGKEGFYKAKVSDIAKEAQIGKGTIYEYFPSKNSLFEEMIKYCIDNYMKRLQDSINMEDNSLDKLKKYLDIEEELIRQHGNMANIIIQEINRIGDNIKNIITDFRTKKINIIQNIIEDGIKKDYFKDVPTYVTSLIFMGSAHQIIVDNIVFRSAENLNEEIDTFLKLFINGIKK